MEEVEARLRTLYVDELKSIPQIAELVGVPASTLQKKLNDMGVPMRTRADGVRLRKDVLGLQAKGRTRTMTPEWRANIAAGRRKWGAENAVGTRITNNGYVEYTVGPHKGRSVHVVKMEERIGRHLHPDEVVHHIDEDKQNNEDDNLALITRAGHMRLHRREERLASKEVF